MYRYEPHPITGKIELIIDGWEKGIADSPFLGMGFLKNGNIKYFPGCIYCNIQRTISTYPGGSAPTSQINYFAQDPIFLKNLYALGLDGVVWQSLDSGKTWAIIPNSPTGSQHGNGIAIYAGWLFICRDTNIDVISLKNDGTGYTGSWTTMTWNGNTIWSTTTQLGGQNHFGLVGRDKIIYFCNGNYISSIVPGSNFNPSTAGTTGSASTNFNWNEIALSLPTVYAGTQAAGATYLCELRTQLLIAFGNFIIPWDRTSTSFDIPVPFTETIAKMVNIDNIIYAFAGSPTFNSTIYNPIATGRGNIYSYNGYNAQLFKKIPDSIAIPYAQDKNWNIGGVMGHLGKLYFGAVQTNGTPQTGGVYSIETITSSGVVEGVQAGAFNFEDATVGMVSPFPTALFSLGDNTVNGFNGSYVSGFTSPTDNIIGFDYTDQSGNRSIMIIKTDVIKVGTNHQQKTFNQIEVRFLWPLAQSESVAISAGKYFADGSLSTVGTYTAPSASTDLSFTFPVSFQNNENIQLKLVCTPVANGSGIPIKEIILR